MKKSRVIIECSSTRLTIHVVVSSRVLRTATARFAGTAPAAPLALDAIQTRAAELLEQLGAKGLPATLIYDSSGSTSGIFSCPKGAGSAAAAQAAMLALSESLGHPVEQGPHDAETIAIDHDRVPDAAPQIHVLGSADREDQLQALCAALNKAGARIDRAVPAAALLLAATLTSARNASAQSTRLVLHVGESSSALIAASRGRVLFVRQIALGVESILHALTRDHHGAHSGLSIDDAEQLLRQHGIPARDEVLDHAKGLRGENILPLVQPVIQRLVQDVRQSIRFGLTDEHRTAGTLVLQGPGASIPRLGALLAEQIGLRLADAAPAAVEPAPNVSALDASGISLLPRDLLTRAVERRGRIGVMVGFAVVLGAIAVDYTRSLLELRALQRELEEVRDTSSTLAELSKTRRELAASEATLIATRARLDRAVGEAPRWSTALAMLGRTTTDVVRLSNIALTFESGAPVVSLQGRTLMPERLESTTALKQFLDALAATPMVESARLGSTQRIETPQGVSASFDMNLTLVPLPAAQVTSAGASKDASKEER